VETITTTDATGFGLLSFSSFATTTQMYAISSTTTTVAVTATMIAAILVFQEMAAAGFGLSSFSAAAITITVTAKPTHPPKGLREEPFDTCIHILRKILIEYTNKPKRRQHESYGF